MTPCTHRGEIWRNVPSKLCGSRRQLVPIYRCSLHTICTPTKYKHGQPETCCLVCDDYQPCETKEAQHDQEDDARNCS